MEFPSVTEVKQALQVVKLEAKRLAAQAKEGDNPEDLYIEVRLQVYDEGGWQLHTGSTQYDDDHTGFWGNDHVGPDSDLREIAEGLIEEARDYAYIYGEEDE